MKYIIIDDEPLAREGVKLNCDDISFLEFAGAFSNPIQAMEILSRKEVDLIFLDIEMPGITGLDFLKNTDIEPLVILSTAYPQYALDAFELNVVDYILKPIRFERFFKAVSKAKEIFELKKQQIHSVESVEDDFIFIRSDRKFIKIQLSDILHIKGLKDYVMIVCEKQKYMTAMNISTILKQLDPNKFIRVAKSYICSIDKITEVGSDFIMCSNTELPLGPSFKTNFIDRVVKQKLVDR